MLFKENDNTRRTPLSLFERVETGGSVLCKHGVVGSFWGLNESRRERKTGEVKRMSLLGWWETTGQARNEKEKERRRKEKRKARMERSRVKRESALQENKPQARRTDQRESSKREKGGEWSQKKVGLLHAVILRYGSGTPRPVRTAGQWRERKVAIRTGTSLSFTFPYGAISLGFSSGNEADGAAPSVTHRQSLLSSATHWYWLRCPPVCRERYIYLCRERNAQW